MRTIGYIGLGKMGRNMVGRLIGSGWKVVATDTSEAARKDAQDIGAHTEESMAGLVKGLATPRTIWIMVPHVAVDAVLAELVPLLSDGDTVIEGGNSFYKESMRRGQELKEKGIVFLDAGTSGGPGGAEAGACVMVGGEKEAYEKNKELFHDIAAENAYGYMGPSGAGHFVKMVHNGIEYGMMQAIGEGFGIMKEAPFTLNLPEIARVYNTRSVIESRLTDWLVKAYQQHGTGLNDISGSVAHSGEGLWTVETAEELGVSDPVIAASLKFRGDSQKKPSYVGKVVSALRNQFGGHEVREDK